MLVRRHGGDTGASQELGPTTSYGWLLDIPEDQVGARLPSGAADALRALGEAIAVRDAGPPGESTIPAVYTYWGQFIDHDVTAGTDTDTPEMGLAWPIPHRPDDVTAMLRNLRRPRLDLDTVYGDGPEGADARLYDGPCLRVGTVSDLGDGAPIPPEDDRERDLPRLGPLLDAGVITDDDIPLDLRNAPHRRSIACIGDLRNDVNLLTAQLHVAYLRFHNRVVERIRAAPADFGLAGPHDPRLFDVARRLVRWHHQYLVLHDYLERVTEPGTVTRMLADGPQHYRPLPDGELWTPLEFAAAASRFGHSMIRDSYDLNRNHGLGTLEGATTTELLFQYTGQGAERLAQNPSMSQLLPFRGRSEVLPADMVWEADRMCDESGSHPARLARCIDWRISATLGNLANNLGEGADDALRRLLRQLPQRTLLRGYVLSLPTGQAAADALDVQQLTADELDDPRLPELAAGGFVKQTPLWFYVLREAEIQGGGNHLGQVGSRVVAETIVGLLQGDPTSYLNADTPWHPCQGVLLLDGRAILTIRDFLQFSGIPA
jgi:hypothetical protein